MPIPLDRRPVRHAVGLAAAQRLLALTMSGWLGAGVFAQTDASDIWTRLAAREQALDRLYVEFDWYPFRCSLDKDPFDPANRVRERTDYQEGSRYWILRPHFRSEFHERDGDARRSAWASWLDGKLTNLTRRSPDDPWSVGVYRSIYVACGVEPDLTPVEWQIFEWPESLYDWMRKGYLRVAERSSARVIIEGEQPSKWRQPPWRVRATLDTQRGYLPVELVARLPVDARHTIEWTMRVLDTAVVRGVHVAREAVLVLRPADPKERYAVFHWIARAIRADDSIDKESLRIELPTENVILVDYTSGLTRHIDANGRVVYEERTTPEEMEKRTREFSQMTAEASATATKLGSRRAALAWIVAGAVLLTGAAAGLSLWRRYHPKPG